MQLFYFMRSLNCVLQIFQEKGDKGEIRVRFKMIIDDETSNMKIEDILLKRLSMSRRQIRKLKNQRLILINNSPAYIKSQPAPGDSLEVIFPEEYVMNIRPEKMYINVIYEDDDLLILNKDPGMTVHPSSKKEGGSLANGVAYYLDHKHENPMIRPVNRLDKQTSGIVIFAKNQYTHYFLQKKGFEKTYIAIVHGAIDNASWITEPIAREEGSIIKRKICKTGKKAVTYIEPIENTNDSTILLVRPLTGRTHQIRLHLSHIGFPIYGDILYGYPDIMQRQALHAWKTRLVLPSTKRQLCCEAPFPNDMKELIKGLDYPIT